MIILDRFDEWDRVANWGWNVSAGLLWDCQAFWNLNDDDYHGEDDGNCQLNDDCYGDIL